MPAPKLKRPSLAWIVIFVVAVALAASVVYLLQGRRAAAPATTDSSTAPAAPAEQTPADTLPMGGSYQVYSEHAFSQAASTDRKVLFFHAGWCPQCRAIEKDITEQGVPSGMVIFKVNYDTADDLKMKYGITLQTTIVEVTSSGDLVKKHVAYSQPNLPAILDTLGR